MMAVVPASDLPNNAVPAGDLPDHLNSTPPPQEKTDFGGAAKTFGLSAAKEGLRTTGAIAGGELGAEGGAALGAFGGRANDHATCLVLNHLRDEFADCRLVFDDEYAFFLRDWGSDFFSLRSERAFGRRTANANFMQ